MSRQQYAPSSSPDPKTSTSREGSQLEIDAAAARRVAATTSEEPTPSSRSPPVVPSSSSEGYPSWLPKRPPPPAPHSTIHSVGMFEPGPSASAGGSEPFLVGRKPTPRSVRVVSMQNVAQGEKDLFGRREATNPSRLSGAAHARVWSRVTSAGLTPTVFSPSPFPTHTPRPRFRTSSFHPELLRHPSWKVRFWFVLFVLCVFLHIPLQTFFDFNAVFVLLLVAKFPNPAAPGVPGSGRNWALGAAAYIACWFTQIFVVFLVYELIYSFIRRWRVKRPLILPIYLSSPAFNFVSVSSYTNFCFMYCIRLSAFTAFGASPPPDSQGHSYDHHGNIRDGLAETFYYYSQNLPTVALLLPRAALSLALLLAYSNVDPSLPAGDAGIFKKRDGTFFRADGTLTGYARGVLIANAAWTAWRTLVLLGSWIGLWVMSGHGFAGLCGPRYRWEEEDAEAEKSLGPYAFKDNTSDHMDTPLPWSWRENTVLRIYETWEFCLTNKYPGRSASGLGKKDGEGTPGFDGMEKVFAAIGLSGTPHTTKRGVLSDDLFESPGAHEKAEEDDDYVDDEEKMATLVPPPAVLAQREKKSTVLAGSSGPLRSLPYPFTTPSSAQVSSASASASSSQEVVPFPPSPGLEVPITDEVGEHDEDHDDDDDEEEEEEEEEHGEEEVGVEESEVPSSERRTSGSMSSLGRPIPSRYPFQFRRPMRGGSVSSVSAMPPPSVSTPRSGNTHSSNPSRSTQSRSTRHSRSTQSTGNPESSDSPMSNGTSSVLSSPVASSLSGGIPMPPRHPQVQRRARAGTVPLPASSPTPSSPSPVVFPAGRPRARTRTESVGTDTSMTFGPIPIPAFDDSDDDDDHHYGHDESLMDVPEAEGSLEEAEQHDSVGLLSTGPSPRGSLVNLRHLGSGLALHHHRRSNGSRSRSATSRSQSRSRTNSSNSHTESARSRAQSLIQSLGAASRSSLDLVRSRANSMARLSDSPYHSSTPDPQPSSPENYTFGHPLREQWRSSDHIDQGGEPEPGEGLAEGDSGLLAAAQIALPPSSPNSSLSESHTDFKSVVSQQPGQSSEHAPSETSRATSSERASERSRHTERGGTTTAPIPIQRGTHLGVPQYTDSQPDISTANQSYVTAPATIEGKTDSSGQPSSWGTLEQYPQAPGGTWQPA